MKFYEQKFSTLDLEYCKQYLRIDEDFIEDDNYICLCLQAAKSFVMEYSEKEEQDLDQIPYTSIVLLKIVAEMYINKTMTITSSMKSDNFTQSLLSKLRSYTV